ncbi:MAG: sensor domain-containing diguanylate cyclase [Spirochaetes bacterium]|nr:sensor domain-containing diguanylate cyclase [Spirochaetota bacterium]
MNKKVIIATVVTALFINLLFLFFETKLANQRLEKKFKDQNTVIAYSFEKYRDSLQAKARSLTKGFFKLYDDLCFIIIKENDEVIFAANKDPGYNRIFSSFLNTLKSDKRFEKDMILKLNKADSFYFSTSTMAGTDPVSLITGYRFQLSSWKIIIRNFLISLLLIVSILFFSSKRKEKMTFEYPDIEQEEEIQKKDELKELNSHEETYKNLHEDNIKLSEEVENLTTFREVGLAINSILNFNQMLLVIMDMVMNKMSVQKIIIYFIDDDNRILLGKIGMNDNKIITEEELINEKVIIGDGSIGKAMEYRTPIITTDNPYHTELISPLTAQNSLIGAIKVSNKKTSENFTPQDKELLRLLSSQIAIALNNARLYEMAITDGLTKLYVHRHFQFKLQEENLRHKRNGKPLSLIMMDIDHFKSFNDTNGHQSGDFVLREISKLLKHMFRATDYIFRYGGEEIALILPETNSDNAYLLAEKIRKNIEEHPFMYNGEKLNVTVSIGLSTYYPQKMEDIDKNKLITMADEALYFSKNNGRNRTTLYTPAMHTDRASTEGEPLQDDLTV